MRRKKFIPNHQVFQESREKRLRTVGVGWFQGNGYLAGGDPVSWVEGFSVYNRYL